MSTTHKNIPANSGQVILKCLKTFSCTIVFCVLATIIFFFLLGLVLIVRAVISLLFKFYFNGKFKLASGADSVYSNETFANAMTINLVVYVQGQTNIYKLRDLWLKRVILHKKADGRQTNKKFLWRGVKKLGLLTWEDFSDRFDIKEHVRFFPGADQSHRVYSEDELLEAVEKIQDKPLSSERPQWEILYAPRLNLDKDGEHYAIILRICHPFCDGLSLFQMIRKLFDSDAKLTLEPVNPRARKSSLLELIGFYFKVFLLGPYAAFKAATLPKNVFQQTDVLKGPKFIGCTKKEITMKSVKHIKDRFNCSTSAVFHSVIAGALRRLAEKKGLPIPEEMNFANTVALIPYPNDEPQNRLTFLYPHSPISIVDPVLRLSKLNGILEGLAPYEKFAFYYFTKLTGYFPTFMTTKAFNCFRTGYLASNVPGFTEIGFIEGNPVKGMYGCPPISHRIGMGIGIISYVEKLRICWMVEKTSLISDKDDMNALVANFEKEFFRLESIALAMKN